MLTIYTLKSAEKAAEYYQKENYYAPEGASQLGIWCGKGAAKLNLSGKATLEQFKAVLEGKLSPNITMEQIGEGEHRPGYDLTFSAPKSVSLLAIIAKDEGVLQAHRTAISKILEHIESNYAATRLKTPEQTTLEQTENLIFCTFEHNDSRMLDPNLHTHVILMNATLRADEEWRTIFGDNLYKDKILLGMFYRCFLAQELMQLGFEIEQTSDKGTFEIRDFPPALIEHFSKRRAQIEAYMQEHGLKGAEGAKIANFETRPNKQQVDIEHLELAWTVQLQSVGYSIEDLEKFCAEAKARGPVQAPDPVILTQKAVELSIQSLSTYQPVFSIGALRKCSALLSLLNPSPTLLDKAIESHFENGSLLYVGNNLCTTFAARDLESGNIASMQGAKDQVHPLFTNLATKFIVYKSVLATPEHEAALSFLLKAKDRQVAVRYQRSQDQSLLMRAYVSAIGNQRLYAIGLTADPIRAESFGEELGLARIQSIEGFLLGCTARVEELGKIKADPNTVPESKLITSKRSKNFGKYAKAPIPKSAEQLKDAREIWILDVQSPVSLEQVHKLQECSTELGARIVWSHHPDKIQAPIRALIQNGINSVQISNGAIESEELWLQEKNISDNFEKLGYQKKLHSIEKCAEREQAALREFLSLGTDPHLIVGSKAQVTRMNAQVREAKKRTGALIGWDHNFETLQALSTTVSQRTLSKFYQLNDVLKLKADLPDLKLRKGEHLKVLDLSLYHNTVKVQDAQNKEQTLNLDLNLAKAIQVYRLENKALSINDSIAWTQTERHSENKSLDRLKHQRATVVALDGSQIEVELKNGKRLKLNPETPSDQHWDHGYAYTFQQAEKLELSKTVLVLDSRNEFLDRRAVLEVLERADNQISLFCDDSKKVQQKLFDSPKDLLALDHPLRDFVKTPDPAQSTELPKAELPKYFFPKLNARMDHMLQKHRDLLEKLIAEEEIEQARDFSVDKPVDPNIAQNDTPPSLQEQEQAKVVCNAIDWLSEKHAERNAVFPQKEIFRDLVMLEGLRFPKEFIEQQFERAFTEGILVRVSDPVDVFDPSSQMIATRETILMEKACIALAEQGRNTVVPIVRQDSKLLETLKQKRLTDGQKAAIHLAITTPDRVIAIQGVAGAGKTTMLKHLNRCCVQSGVEVIGLSNNTNARERLAEGSADHSASESWQRAGIKTFTTRKFLNQCTQALKQDPERAAEIYGKTSIVLDESSFASTRDVFSLLTLVKKLDLQLILMGDYKQQNSIEAGRLLYLMLGSKIQSVAMTENVRLSDHQALKTMQHLYRAEIKQALDNLGKALIEIPDHDARLEYIANLYLESPSTLRADTLVITPLNEDRAYLNQMIYQGLKQLGELKGRECEFDILTSVGKTHTQMQKVSGFSVGDQICFNQNAIGVPIGTGEYCTVLETRYSEGLLLLERPDQTKVFLSPERNISKDSGAIEVYQARSLSVMPNTLIRWHRNDEKRGIRNGEQARVLEFRSSEKYAEPSFMEVILKNGDYQVLDLSENRNKHWDLAYASTTFSAQGADKAYTIAHGSGGETPEDLLVALTRGDKITLVVENRQEYEDAVVAKLEAKRSTQEYIDPNREKVRDKVQAMIQNIRGRAENKQDPKTASQPAPGSKKSQQRSETPSTSETPKQSSETPQSSTAQKSEREKPSKTSSFKEKSTYQASDTSVKKSPRKKGVYIEQREVIARLHKDVLGTVTSWLGPPKRKVGQNGRWADTLEIKLSGDKAGYWKIWNNTKGGKNLLSFYIYYYGLNYKEALAELAGQLGIAASEYSNSPEAKIKAAKLERERVLQAEKNAKIAEQREAEKIKDARALYAKGVPIQGTLAEKYLREYRKITGVLPADFRFCSRMEHPFMKYQENRMYPVLMAPIRNAKGEMTAIVRIFLDNQGQKFKASHMVAGKEQKIPAKLNRGSQSNAAVLVNAGKSTETLYIAEGLETALSIANAFPDKRIMALLSASSFQNAPLSTNTRTIVLCADEDGVGANSTSSVMKAANFFRNQDLAVEIAFPTKDPLLAKTDFNDVLKKGGIQAVTQSFEHTIPVRETLTEQKLEALKIELARTKEESVQKTDKSYSSQNVSTDTSSQKSQQQIQGLER